MIAMKCTRTLVYAGRRLNTGDSFFAKTDRDAQVLTAIKKAERSADVIKIGPIAAQISEKTAPLLPSADVIVEDLPQVEAQILDLASGSANGQQDMDIAREEEQQIQPVEEVKTDPASAASEMEPGAKKVRNKRGAAKQ